MKYDLRSAIQLYLPSLIKLLGDNNISWREINRAFSRFLEKTKEEYERRKEPIQKEASFYTIIKNKGICYCPQQFRQRLYLVFPLPCYRKAMPKAIPGW